MNRTLNLGEMHGVPKEQWRMRGGNAASGVSIIAEQLPIIEECEGRQQLLESTEKDLALVTLMTVSAWLGTDGEVTAPIGQAIASFDMAIQWPPLTKNRPVRTSIRAAIQIVNGLISEIQAWQARTGGTREEAIEHLCRWPKTGS